jgi:predicted CopG family antitoxin
MKTLKITEKTHKKLVALGKKSETFDELIDRLIEERTDDDES